MPGNTRAEPPGRAGVNGPVLGRRVAAVMRFRHRNPTRWSAGSTPIQLAARVAKPPFCTRDVVSSLDCRQ